MKVYIFAINLQNQDSIKCPSCGSPSLSRSAYGILCHSCGWKNYREAGNG